MGLRPGQDHGAVPPDEPGPTPDGDSGSDSDDDDGGGPPDLPGGGTQVEDPTPPADPDVPAADEEQVDQPGGSVREDQPTTPIPTTSGTSRRRLPAVLELPEPGGSGPGVSPSDPGPIHSGDNLPDEGPRDSTRDPSSRRSARLHERLPFSPIVPGVPFEPDLTPREESKRTTSEAGRSEEKSKATKRERPDSGDGKHDDTLAGKTPGKRTEKHATSKRRQLDSTREAHEATFSGKTPGKKSKDQTASSTRGRAVTIPFAKRPEFQRLTDDIDVNMRADLESLPDARDSIKRTLADTTRTFPIASRHKKHKGLKCQDCKHTAEISGRVVTHCQKHCIPCVDSGSFCTHHCPRCFQTRPCRIHCTKCSRHRTCGIHRTMRKCSQCTDARVCREHRL